MLHYIWLFTRWTVLCLLDWLLLITLPVAVPLIAAFTREDVRGQQRYTWGWIWGTYDNPPQGDAGYVSKRCLYPNVTTGFKGYLNRVWWMFRNQLYGLARLLSVEWSASHTVKSWGKLSISDKYKVPGWYFALVFSSSGRPIAFELYVVKPWSETRDLRMRLGWKVMTDKTDKYGFAQLVNTINPFDGYGDKDK
jgi:hypothetical protein